jgi:hypothetical protein
MFPVCGVVLTFGSMYRGISPPLLGVTPIFAISFWVGAPGGPWGQAGYSRLY